MKTRILFVCMGNICRSPMAEGAFRSLVDRHGMADRFEIDSAGTIDYHAGESPDERARIAMNKRGIDLSGLRARQYHSSDFETFDYILAMDHENRRVLLEDCPGDHEHKVRLFLEFAPHLGVAEVPDPYFGGDTGFEQVFELVDAASEGLLEHLLREQHVQP